VDVGLEQSEQLVGLARGEEAQRDDVLPIRLVDLEQRLRVDAAGRLQVPIQL
jgi:hypothetical protein